MDTRKFKSQIRDFWSKNELKIVLFLGYILVAGIAYEAGILKGSRVPENPLIIEKTAQNGPVTSAAAPEAPKTAQDASKADVGVITPGQKCAFVGSKNSNKYHLPDCRWAKNIKPENIVCFSSVQDAAAKGYLPDKNCINRSNQ